jgi:hypothetical protein
MKIGNPICGALIFNKPTVARPTALRPDNEDSVALEVLIPPVLPRVKQPVLARIAVVGRRDGFSLSPLPPCFGFARLHDS